VKETFAQVEKHLYKRQYQIANGDWATAFYARFTDWQGIRRKFPAGDNLEDARDELGRLHTLNKGRHDWDAEKREREKAKIQGMTIDNWADCYLQLEEVKSKRSLSRDVDHIKTIKRHLGAKQLTDLEREDLFGYKKRFRREPSS
jgi:hypothetical protein